MTLMELNPSTNKGVADLSYWAAGCEAALDFFLDFFFAFFSAFVSFLDFLVFLSTGCSAGAGLGAAAGATTGAGAGAGSAAITDNGDKPMAAEINEVRLKRVRREIMRFSIDVYK